MKKIHIGIAVLALSVLAGCGSASVAATAKASASASAKTIPAVRTDVQYADMSKYQTYSDTTEYHFVETTLAQAKEMRDAKATFALFMGYSECGYCNAAMPVINADAVKYGVDVYYVDTAAAQKDGSLDEYHDDIVDQFKDEFSQEEDGSYSIHVPIIAFYVNGELYNYHVGFVEDYDPADGLPTTEELTQYVSIIDPSFQKVVGA